jgi:hypothetical protein
MTEQSHQNLTDINVIVERFRRTGGIPLPEAIPVYEDVTAIQGDYRERLAHLERVRSAVDSFYRAEVARNVSQAGDAPADPPSRAEGARNVSQAGDAPADAPPAS